MSKAERPLREEWGLLHTSGNTDMRRDRAHAESGVGNGWAVARRLVSDWLPVDRAEGDGKTDCGCAHCHSRPYSIMHICPDCGSKRCPRAAHHVNPCEADR